MESSVATSKFLEEFLSAEYRYMLDLTTFAVGNEAYIEKFFKV